MHFTSRSCILDTWSPKRSTYRFKLYSPNSWALRMDPTSAILMPKDPTPPATVATKSLVRLRGPMSRVPGSPQREARVFRRRPTKGYEDGGVDRGRELWGTLEDPTQRVQVPKSGSFHELGVLLVGVLAIRAALFKVYNNPLIVGNSRIELFVPKYDTNSGFWGRLPSYSCGCTLLEQVQRTYGMQGIPSHK